MLIARKNTRYCGIDVVEAATTPPGTETHKPVSHKSIIDQIKEQVLKLGFNLTDEKYSMDRSCDKMFAVLDYKDSEMPDGIGLVIGARNDHRKRLAMGLAGGNRVFCCDNLSFIGDILLFRKHTKKINVIESVGKFIKAIVDAARKEATWMDSLKTVHLPLQEAKTLVVDAYRKEACTEPQLSGILKHLFPIAYGENGVEQDPLEITGWTAYQAFTNAYKTGNPDQTMRRCKRLNRLFSDMVLPRVKAAPVSVSVPVAFAPAIVAATDGVAAAIAN